MRRLVPVLLIIIVTLCWIGSATAGSIPWVGPPGGSSEIHINVNVTVKSVIGEPLTALVEFEYNDLIFGSQSRTFSIDNGVRQATLPLPASACYTVTVSADSDRGHYVPYTEQSVFLKHGSSLTRNIILRTP